MNHGRGLLPHAHSHLQFGAPLSTPKRKSAVILGAQWGDEGKGKIVDVLSEKFSVVARYAGGHNAGHTVIIAGRKFVLQLIPCGVLRPECRGVIGNGVVLDPMAFLSEVKKLKDAGLPITGGPGGQLFVSNRAQVILPYHRMIELAAENAPGRTKIGTTSRGIGPAYEDKMARSGLRIVDLLNEKILKSHIENACQEKNAIAHALFGSEPIDPAKMFDEYAAAAEQVRPFVTDTGNLLNKVIAEGGGPRECVLALGYAGWGPGQLDQEIQQNSWLSVSADETLLFDGQHDTKWRRAFAKLRVDPVLLSEFAGHA